MDWTKLLSNIVSPATVTTFHGRFNWTRIDWIHILMNLTAAAAIAILGVWLSKRLSNGLHRILIRAHVEITLANFLRNIAYALLLIVVSVSVLQRLGVPATSLAAVVGATGLAVGLALKDSLSNIAAGVMLIVLGPVRSGDHVVIAGQEGIIDEIRIFQTRLRTFDQRIITLPNSTITTVPIINYSTLPTRRVEITVGVSYQDNLKQAQELLVKIARENPKILDDPAPLVYVNNLGESSVDLLLLAYTQNDNFNPAKSEILEQIHNQLPENGLNIPYPQRDLHLYHHDTNNGKIASLLLPSVTDKS
ncbi:mechanosensitive ion channel family protein [Xylella fastidiosa subsp. morus]|jgi:small-conductance mechanosensitive channel|uniref:Small-conductance mechanosensitive channel n=3 Tax=Xylella fastidiosa TaxID=2371 RepID=Q87E06_XYLFT|nr:mechanosensitive ion channel family protein [Xylella fastidiosa]ADN63522.1 small conductance mechanosensitive ion channel [Xylella fastidiosa subsp. fastidiosa GB514]KAF0571494.1 small conductance mechanosensitive channel protein MscS [Xylella fastidiosa subsp. fastidiosa Mus-1]AAO28396.1 small conductance mechanosensitive ion channel [Xylella fastidiosa Temecula1]ACB91991.1 MscS Mechanosensitive ion channel [Xylella fastidiosa M23]AIC12069.1 small conductance mechanosensitive channel prote